MSPPLPHDDDVLIFENVRAILGDGDNRVVALDGVDFGVARGAVQAIIGASGAGKSTLFRCAATLLKPTHGSVFIDGVDVAHADPLTLRGLRQRLGVVSQHLHLLSSRTAADNIALPLELAGADVGTRRARVAELLDWVGLTSCATRYPAQLSGGQRQRVAIARALVTSPQLLLCDEPTSALDPLTSSSILDVIGRVRAELGVTVVIVTHEMDVVRRLADDVVVLAGGVVVQRGAPAVVLPAIEKRGAA